MLIKRFSDPSISIATILIERSLTLQQSATILSFDSRHTRKDLSTNIPPPPTSNSSLSLSLLSSSIMATPPESTSIPFPVEDSSDDKPPPPRKRSAFASRSNLPFARSALNRNSVMCLPSIAHLQHGFAKMGIKEANSAASSSSSLGKTAGGGGGRKSIAEMVGGPLTVEETERARRRTFDVGQASSFDDEKENDESTLDTLGPEPEKPELDTRMPWEKTGDIGRVVKDEKELRLQVHKDIEHVCDKWGLVGRTASSSQRRRQSRSSYASSGSTAVNPLSSSSSASSRPLSPSAFSDSTVISSSTSDVPLVLDLLTTTNAAIRSVQSWIVSLPLSSPATSTVDDPLQVSTAARPRTSLALPVSVSSRPNPSSQPLSRQSSSTSSTTDSSDPNDGEQLVNALRKQTLQVLGMLRDLESKHQSSARSLEPSSTEFPSFPSSSTETNEDPKERSANYDASVSLETLELEANVVDEWIEAVERVVEYIERRKRLERRKEGSFAQSGRDENDRDVRRVPVGEGSEDEEEKEVLPSWAEKDEFASPLGTSDMPSLSRQLSKLTL